MESDEVKVKPPELVPSSREVKVSGTDHVLVIEKGFAVDKRLPTLQN